MTISNYEKAKATSALGPIAAAQAIDNLTFKIQELELLTNARIKMLEEKVEQLQKQIAKAK